MTLGIIIPNTRVNGIKTYVYHLAMGLTKSKIHFTIMKPHHTTENNSRKFIGDIRYWNMSSSGIQQFARDNPCLISELLSFEDTHLLERLVSIHRAVPMTHRSKDYYNGDQFLLRKNGIVIRKRLLELVPNSVFIPHPYQTQCLNYQKNFLACSMTRLENEKNTHVVLETKIKRGAPIDIYGPLMPFYGMKLKKLFGDWKQYWEGNLRYEDVIKTLCRYKYSIDLSNFPEDGAGTQYSFLEALDCRCIPIVHENWLGGPYVDGKTCIAVSDSNDLMEAIRKNINTDKYRGKILKSHDASTIAKRVFAHCLKVKEGK